MDLLLESVGLTATEEIRQLYGWRNGTDLHRGAVIEDLSLFPMEYMPSLQHSIGDYSVFEKDSRWRPGWFPVFADGGGDFYIVDLRPGAAPQVIHFWIDETERPVEYESLSSMLAAKAKAFEDNLVFVSDDGWLSVDSDAYARLARELNPEVSWWA